MNDTSTARSPGELGNMLQRALWTASFCAAIAGLITVLRGGSFWVALIYSMSIGLSCWALIDGGRLLSARWLARIRPDNPELAHGWPGWPWMSAILLLGSFLGYGGGTLFAQWLTGTAPHPEHGESLGGYTVMLLVTVGIGATLTRIQQVKGQLAHAQAQAEAERRLTAETQLKLLQSQLEPHMLFNTLANLRVLISVDPSRAQAMLDHLIAFLRATLKASRETGTHSLADEFDRLSDYLALMAVRMGPRLQTRIDLPADLREQPVPALLLQPLVENAIRHGLEPQAEGGCIDLSAHREGDQLILTVRDSGIGLPKEVADAAQAGGGFGLTQVRERLATLYGEKARLTLAAADESGTCASLNLPMAP
jgi:sensor histidine kinase YesM